MDNGHLVNIVAADMVRRLGADAVRICCENAEGADALGDALSAKAWRDIADADLRDAVRAFTRQALHAWRLEVIHPLTGVPLRIEASPPRDLQRLLAAAGLVQCAR